MPAPVITVENLGKRYYLSHQKRSDTLRDTLAQQFRGLFGGAAAAGATEEFWALRDVSFQINQGDVVGIIGRNGAGKSTLLKLLSRITDPTTGRAVIRGRVASLLEVGTGFHPELSGRENIFLNGAILGMSRTEIARKFDEIVAFAEVERFLDTQVKHYSSGMYVRLAFAVAAHLEPEILIVDEVLAVGDAAFQAKCLGKIGEVTRDRSRTVLIVSHNMDSILRLCSSAIVLGQGRLEFHGSTSLAVARYAQVRTEQPYEIDCESTVRPAWTRGGIVVSRLTHPDVVAPWTVPFGGTLDFTCDLAVRRPTADWQVYLAFFSTSGVEVAATQSLSIMGTAAAARCRLRCQCEDFRLTPGNYRITLGVRSGGHMEDILTEIVQIEVLPTADSAAQHADAFRGFYVPKASYRLA
ncbi:MAG TPA: ABC transporter ATP-binding protein [Lacunisphaera sp.]